MIKTIISLLFVLVVLNALARVGTAVWNYYQLKDEAQQQIVFGGRSSTTDLHGRILAKAEELEVPLEPADLYVTREGGRTFVDAYYSQPVELFPNLTYTLDLSFSVEAFAADVATPGTVR